MIYPELKARQQQVILDLSLVSECAFTGPTSFEPFPTFLLKNSEMRSKWGYLDEIQNAKMKGFTGNVKWTDDNNKNLARIFEIFGKISSIQDIIASCHSDEDLINHFNMICDENESLSKDIYKFL